MIYLEISFNDNKDLQSRASDGKLFSLHRNLDDPQYHDEDAGGEEGWHICLPNGDVQVQEVKIPVSLLCTCRQIQSECVRALYSSMKCTVVSSMSPRSGGATWSVGDQFPATFPIHLIQTLSIVIMFDQFCDPADFFHNFEALASMAKLTTLWVIMADPNQDPHLLSWVQNRDDESDGEVLVSNASDSASNKSNFDFQPINLNCYPVVVGVIAQILCFAHTKVAIDFGGEDHLVRYDKNYPCFQSDNPDLSRIIKQLRELSVTDNAEKII